MREPTAIEPALVTCVKCDGKPAGCALCGGRGTLDIPRCPKLEVDGEIWEAIGLSIDAENGLLPVSGGVLDQSRSWNQFRRYYEREENRMRAEMAERQEQMLRMAQRR